MSPNYSTALAAPEAVSTLVDSSHAQLAACLGGAVERWQAGGQPDARELFRQHPELESSKSFALDAIYDEFRLRRAQGENLSPAAMLERYPRYRSSLTRLFAVHDAVGDAARDASPETLLASFRFEPIERLGRGALSEVFLVRNLPLGGRLSVVKLGLRTEEEAHLWGGLDHPGIVPVLSFHQSPRFATTGVCMPFLGRATLCDLIDARFGQVPAPDVQALEEQWAKINVGAPNAPPRARSRCYEDLVLRIGQSLAEALHYTHAQGVLHLDLKPSNVLLPGLEAPRLMDFNLSANLGNSRAARGGTLPYIAPEQLELLLDGRHPPALTESADVYAFGAVLYELLAGEPPFTPAYGELDVVGPGFLEQQRAGAPRLRGVGPPRLVRLVEECLSFDPGRRPASAGEIAKCLERQLSRPRVELRALRRNPLHGLALGAGAVVLASAVAVPLALRPPLETRLLRAAELELSAGNYSAATERYTAALQAAPHSDSLYLGRAEAWIRRGQPVAAQADYAEVLERNPQHPTALIGTGYCLSKQRRHAQALVAYGSLPAAERSTPIVRNNLAVALHHLGRHREALDELNAALVEAPDHPTLRLNRAATLSAVALQSSEPVEPMAWDDIGQAIQTGPASGGQFLTAAVILAQLAAPPSDASEQMTGLLRSAVQHGLTYDDLAADPRLERWLTPADRSALRQLRPLPDAQARYEGLLLPARAP